MLRYPLRMLRQYLYISTAGGLDDRTIEDILESAERNNRERAITGLLLYNGRNFLQLLEGGASDLFWIMRKIGSDPRHHGVTRLADRAVDARACPDWAMRRIRIADRVEDRRAALERELPVALHPTMRDLILNFAALN